MNLKRVLPKIHVFFVRHFTSRDPVEWEKLTKDSRFPLPGATTIPRKRHSEGIRGEIGSETVGNRKKVDGIMTGRYRDESSMEDTGRDCCSAFKAKNIRYPQVETQQKWDCLSR